MLQMSRSRENLALKKKSGVRTKVGVKHKFRLACLVHGGVRVFGFRRLEGITGLPIAVSSESVELEPPQTGEGIGAFFLGRVGVGKVLQPVRDGGILVTGDQLV